MRWKCITIVGTLLLICNVINAKITKNSTLGYYEDEERNDPVAVDYRRQADHALDLGYPEKSITLYQKAIAKDSHYSQAYINLAGVYLELDQFDLSIDTAKKGLEAGPKKKNYAGLLYFNIGLSYLKKAVNNAPESDMCDSRILDAFNKSLELYPENKNIYFQVGAYTNDCLKKPQEAVWYFKKGCNLGDDAACNQYQNFIARGFNP